MKNLGRLILLLFLAWQPMLATGAKIVKDNPVKKQLQNQIKEMDKTIQAFDAYHDAFNASVKTYGQEEFGIENLDELIDEMLQDYQEAEILYDVPSRPPPRLPTPRQITLEEIQYMVDRKLLNPEVKDVIRKVGLPRTMTDQISNRISKYITKKTFDAGIWAINQASVNIAIIRNRYENLWNGYVLSDVTADQYFDIRNQYMQATYDTRQSVFDEATRQLEYSSAMIADIENDMKRTPEVGTSLQQSLQLLNRQLARIAVQNANLSRLYAQMYIEENATATVQLKDSLESDRFDQHTHQVMQNALDATAEDLGMDKRFVKMRRPGYDE